MYIYVSVNWVNNALDDDMSLVWHQTIIKANLDFRE